MRRFNLIQIIAVALIVGFTFTSCRNNEETGEEMSSETVLMKIENDPLVAYNIWFKVGSANDPQGKEGLANLTAQLMTDGSTTKNDYSTIMELLFPMATVYGAKVDKEMTTFQGRVHKDNLEKYSELFLDAIMHPAFDEEDFTRVKNNTLNFIKNELRYASDEELRSLTFWTMGSLGHAAWDDLVLGAPFMILALMAAPWLARPLDAFLLGESVVGHLGYRTATVKKVAILVVGLGVGAAVAVSGLIGFVGLVVPHLVRQLLGASHRVVLPVSALMGGTLLVAADAIARVVVAPAELPIGLMMSLIGGPFFLGLLMRRKVM